MCRVFYSVIFILTILFQGVTPAMAIDNPLLNQDDLPNFDLINASHFEEAVQVRMQEYRAAISKVEATTEITWDTIVQPLEIASEKFSQTWNVISHLNGVHNTDEVRAAYEKILPQVSDFFTEVMQNESLYKKYQALRDSNNYETLSAAQKMIIENELRDFKLSGVSLPKDKREQFKTLNKELSDLGNKFSKNILDATLGFSYHIKPEDKSRLDGLPEHAIIAAATKAKAKDKDGYLLTLDFPSYYAIVSYAKDRQLRELFYTAYATRASEQGPNAGKWDNSKLIDEILERRQVQAKLLDFENYSEYSIQTKMAPSPLKVIEFLEDLAHKSKAQAKAEYQVIKDFAKIQDGITNFAAWDFSYYAEKYQEENYKISTEDLRPYFQEEKVLQGMFNLIGKLYGLSVKEEQNFTRWHDTVRFFSVWDENNNLRGKFYTDLYARDHKRGGAWMADLHSRMKLADGTIQTPIAFLEANFTPAVAGKPAILTHDEVITLFHEFGHTLQHILTQVDYMGVSGINGVPWDAVELPSQFMENWCWEWDVIQDISEHYETGDKLPKAMFDKLLATKNYNSAIQMVRQLEFALFDYRIHLQRDTDKGKSVQQILDEVRQEVAVIEFPEFHRFQHSFSHIFDGGYDSGYYSYKWAEVLSSDVFEKFVENGTFNKTVGKKFLTTVLEQGGAVSQMDLFVEFRGREPSIEPLLKHSGISS